MLNKKNYITACVFILILFLLCLSGHSQQPDLTKKITVNYEEVPLEKVIKNISRSTNIQFSYSSKKIQLDRKITYKAIQVPVEQVLYDIFMQAGVQYFIVNDYLVLKSNSEEKNEEKIEIKPELYTLSGTIFDSANNEVLIGASIYIKETGIGTLTNNYGFFSLTLPRGIYTFESSHLGYSVINKKIDLAGNFKWNIRLDPVPFEMKEIIISSINKEEKIFNSLAAQNNVDAGEVQQHSAAMGETDMLKSLGTIPGISFQSDGSSYFSVRGGGRDQNLVLLDEAPIYSPSHMLGLFTPVIPEAVKHAEVYKADFPVQYGGRLSSVIDIRTRDGNMQNFSGSSSIGYISTRASLEGPFKKNSSSYFVSFRRSLFGMFIKKAAPSVQDFYFTDFTAKFNVKLGQRDRLFITFFSGKDVFMVKPAKIRNGLEWGNNLLTLRWNHIFGNRLFTNTTFYSSKYNYSLFTNFDKNVFWNSNITGTNLKSEGTWFINPQNRVKFGFSFGGYFFNPGNFNSGDSVANSLKISQINSAELIFYAGNEHELTKWLIINYGIRFSNWSNYGEASVTKYDNNYQSLYTKDYLKGEQYYSFNFPEPRISISLKSGKFSSFKLSFNRTVQHINLINNSISPLNSFEVWIPSGPNIKPQYANIFDAGFVKNWQKQSIDFYTDVYFKKMYNQVAFASHAETFLNPYLESEIRQGDGRAYGFEILLKKTMGKLSGQIGYSYSRSFLKIDGLNNGREFISHQDRPVDISFVADYRIRPRWTVTLTTEYASGMAVTTPAGFYSYRGVQVPVYPEINNDRLPDYKRTDIGSVWRLNKIGKHFEHYLTFSIYNLFNNKNFVFVNFNKTTAPDGKFYVPADNLNMSDQVATYRYIYSRIPSLTYNLKF